MVCRRISYILKYWLRHREKATEDCQWIIFSSIGLGRTSAWLARKAKTLMKVEDEGIQPAREFAEDLIEKVIHGRHRFKRIVSRSNRRDFAHTPSI